MKHPRGHLCLLPGIGRLNLKQLGKDELPLGTAAPHPASAECPPPWHCPPFLGKCAPHCWCKQRSGLCLRKRKEVRGKIIQQPWMYAD